MGIVVVEDDISFRDIGKIVVWSVISGIPWITIFDKNGVCKKNYVRLQEAINAEQRQAYLKSTTCDIKLHNGSCRESSLGQGSASGNVIVVSPADGRDQLAVITADLAHMYNNQRLSLADFNVSKINSIIADYYGFPDPDLLMKFGPVDAVLGYLPWHMRLTEIVSWPTHRGMTYATFHELLVTYAGTQQRCGK